MSIPKFPALKKVLDLACKVDANISECEIVRQHKRGRFDAELIDMIWPEISERKRSFMMGLSVYQGNVCKNNHDGMRYIKSSACVHCNRELSKKFAIENREKSNSYHREWRKKNADYCRLKGRARYQVRKERLLKAQAA